MSCGPLSPVVLLATLVGQGCCSQDAADPSSLTAADTTPVPASIVAVARGGTVQPALTKIQNR